MFRALLQIKMVVRTRFRLILVVFSIVDLFERGRVNETVQERDATQDVLFGKLNQDNLPNINYINKPNSHVHVYPFPSKM